MNINRNNYEEYFLLYADNELSNTEKKVVEIFLQENIDLKEEFYMIQLTVNAPEENIKLADKSFLLKKDSSSFINADNHEAIFVLYHDGELTASQKEETENFIKENPQYKEEFELIGKAKLTPDTAIVFPGKKQLYRKEKSGRVIPLILWRSLAVAVLIGFGLWITIPYINKSNNGPAVTTPGNVAANDPAVTKIDSSEKNIIPKKVVDQKNNIASVTEPKILPNKEKENREKDFGREKDIIERDTHKEQIAKNNIEVKNSPEQNSSIKELAPEEKSNQIAANIPAKAVPGDLEKTNELPTEEITAHTIKAPQEIDTPVRAQYASYTADAEPNNENYVFYDVSSEDFNKSKVGGFLKKVKRIVKRNNPINHLFGGNEEQVAAK